jgi:uncharacterized protein (DUF1800 family)
MQAFLQSIKLASAVLRSKLLSRPGFDHPATLVLTAMCAIALSACGGGTGSSSNQPPTAVVGGTVTPPPNPNPNPNPAPAPAPAPAEKPATRNEAARFLAQATFGPVDADIDRLMLIGYSAWIDEQFNAPRIDTHRALYERAALQFDPDRKPSLEPVWASFWKHALTGSDQLRQRMAYALSQIFVISLENNTINDDPRAVAAWMDLLSNNSFGSYRKLLEDVALNPQMGVYLTHIRNQKADLITGRVPDQNFAREIMQLFTIGVVELNEDGSARTGANNAVLETYTPDDVAGLASVFTGWSWDCPAYPSNNCFVKGSVGPGGKGENDPDRRIKPMRPYAQFHSTEAKTFLGTTIPAQTTSNPADSLRIALDRLAAHSNVGPFIGRQLIQRFTTSNPSPAYVKAVAQAFANNGSGVRGDMKATLKAVLMHPEARVVSDTSGKVREPVLRLSAFMRAFSHKSGTGNFLVGNTSDPGEALAQTPLYAPSVFNFYRPGYVAPGSQSASRKLVAPELQITSELTVAGYANYMVRGISDGVSAINHSYNGTGGRDLKSDYSAELALVTDVPALVDRITSRLTYGAAGPALRTEIVNAVSSIAIPTTNQTRIDAAKRNRVNAAILLTVASPEFVVLK